MRSAPGLAVIDEDPAEVKIPVPVEVVVGGMISIFAALQQALVQPLERNGSRTNLAAAAWPERMAPSMVVGRPVSIHSPARRRLLSAASRRGVAHLLGRRQEGGAMLLDHPDLGHRRAPRPSALTSRHTRSAMLAFESSTSVRAALMVTEARLSRTNSHCAVPPISPSSGNGSSGKGVSSIRKWRLTMGAIRAAPRSRARARRSSRPAPRRSPGHLGRAAWPPPGDRGRDPVALAVEAADPGSKMDIATPASRARAARPACRQGFAGDQRCRLGSTQRQSRGSPAPASGRQRASAGC